MEGTIINNIYDPNPNLHMETLHLCVFPLETESIILLFYHRKDKSYRRLRHQFNSISEDKRIQYINYLIFAYTENYYFSKQIQTILETNKNLKLLSKENNGAPNLGIISLSDITKPYTPIKAEQIPNFLSEQYKLS